jgi:NTP pyrophosphatase (non-canonical NTP hydrolase)
LFFADVHAWKEDRSWNAIPGYPLECIHDDEAKGLCMNRTTDRLETLRAGIAAFVAERDWDQFHNPKNLAMALAAEAGELLEHFQWLTPAQASDLPAGTRDEVALECADVLLYLLRLTDKLGIDLAAAAEKKLALNAQKYPVEKARGRMTKYDKL